ncbi:MAG: hypothetical protein NTY12_01470 [Candidatus Falkowbacteria bacterium]|nr:hypothetical protein [Candidatus Falkowbacteria bacterium]
MKKNNTDKQYQIIIDKGKNYLESLIVDGLCTSFHQFRRGPSDAWTSACIGSTLATIGKVRSDILFSLLKLQRDSGGWAYNHLASADADTTLRVLQFFNKIGFSDVAIINPAIEFIYQHQDVSGGICTFTLDELASMGRPERIRYAMPHLDVSALALNVLPESERKEKISEYVFSQIKNTFKSYWWRTNYYVAYEVGKMFNEKTDDSISTGLEFLLYAKLKQRVPECKITNFCKWQFPDGSFPSSYQLQLPRPLLQYSMSSEEEIELVEDNNKIFSTATAIVAISRQLEISKRL